MIKICIVLVNRANYGRCKSLLIALSKNKNVILQIIVSAGMLLEKYGEAKNFVERDGFFISKCIHSSVAGGDLAAQVKSSGLGSIELSSAFEDLSPDMVITIADRYETISTAIAAAYMNIPLIHLQGGDISGNIDDKVRNAVSMFADYHFPSSELSRNKLISMGIKSDRVFNFGCPSIDLLIINDLEINQKKLSLYNGTGIKPNWLDPYVLVLQHPVTTSYGNGAYQIEQTLLALKDVENINKIVLWPNPDAGSDHLSKTIRKFKEENSSEEFAYYKNFSPEDYACILNNAKCLIGNSSSFIREASFLGVPSVIIGDRQNGRETGKNVYHVGYEKKEIKEAINKQLSGGRFEKDTRFGNGNAGVNIANKILEIFSIN